MSTSTAVPTLDFDHHAKRTSHHRDEVLAEVALRPIFWAEAHTIQWWCMVRWSLDGATAWGELQEFYPLQQNRRYMRGLRP